MPPGVLRGRRITMDTIEKRLQICLYILGTTLGVTIFFFAAIGYTSHELREVARTCLLVLMALLGAGFIRLVVGVVGSEYRKPQSSKDNS